MRAIIIAATLAAFASVAHGDGISGGVSASQGGGIAGFDGGLGAGTHSVPTGFLLDGAAGFLLDGSSGRLLAQ